MSPAARTLASVVAGVAMAAAASIVHANGMDVIGHSGSGSRSISGRLHLPTGEPAAGVCVTAFASEGEDPSLRRHVMWEAQAVTGADGRFSMHQMVPGDYKIRFGHCTWNSPTRVLHTWFRSTATYQTASPVHLSYDQDTVGIDDVVSGF